MLVAAAAAVALLATSAQAQTLGSLKDDRAAGRFSVGLPFNPTQRNTLLTQVETILGKAWVNYESKLTNYGAPADPMPIIRDLRQNLATVSDLDLHLKISDAFIGLRDLHTRFFIAGPHRCFFATTGLFFDLIESADIVNAPRVIVSRKDTREGLAPILGADFDKVAEGDEVLAINGDTFGEWFKKNQYTTGGGANNFGGHRRALDYLNLVPGSINRLPAQDTITFTLKSRATGATYTSTINYATSRNNACWTAVTNLYKRLTNTNVPGASAADALLPQEAEPVSVLDNVDPLKRPLAVIESPFLDNKKAALGDDLALGPVKLNPTDTNGLSWGIWDPQGKNLGVLRLDDFSPNNLFGGIDRVRNLLANQLKDTNAVLIDIRDNPGGIITYANSIPQFFKADFVPFGARFLYNDVMKRTFVDPAKAGDAFYDAYTRTAPGSKYTEIGLFDTQEAVNTYGQAYLKPVGILNNGRCYSACDLLSANFQNSGTGIIFGEDGQTGAGGANILQLDQLIRVNPIDFQPVPFVTDLTVGTSMFANRVTVGIRQLVRNGAYNGTLIEDVGIKSDVIVRARLEDLLPGATTSSQFDRIADALAAEGKRTGQAGRMFDVPSYVVDISSGNAKISPVVAGIDEVSVLNKAGKTIGHRRDLFAGVGKPSHPLPVSFAPVTTGLTKGQVSITGKQAGKQVLKTNRYIRVVPADADRINLKDKFTWTRVLTPAVGIYNAGASLANPALGWNKPGGSWVVGAGSYVNDIDTSMDFFFTAPVGSKLTINLRAEYDTEPDYDVLYFNYVDSNGNITPIITSQKNDATVPGVSGEGVIEYDKPLTFTTTTEKFSLSVRFVSDNVQPGGTVKFSSLAVAAA